MASPDLVMDSETPGRGEGAKTALSLAGVLIRYSFYLVGAVVLGAIGLSLMFVSSFRVNKLDEQAAFRLAAASLERIAPRDYVATGRGIGRIEMRHYGELHSRDFDLSVMLVMPPKEWSQAGNIVREVKSIPDLHAAPTRFGSRFYDLETRFGDVRAVDLVVDADGLRKLCLAFLSRFDTAAVYLKGWYCEANGGKPSADRLACMLDRLSLTRELAVKEADAFLRARTARASSCWARPVAQTADTRDSNRISSPARWSRPSAQQRY
jgi:hypothetical protein